MKLSVISTTSPTFMFLEVNQRCNLRCGHCDFWKRDDKDKAGYLRPERQRELIQEFKEIGGKNLVICGGEPMLDPDIYYHLAGCGREVGLHVLSVVNGTRVRNEAEAERVILEGPHEVSISFDDHRQEEHDEHRGIKGAWERSKKAVELLCKARDTHGAGKVHIMGLVHAGNYQELEGFYEFAFGLGVDKLKLNMLQPSFGSLQDKDTYYEKFSQLNVSKLMDVLQKCDEKFKLGFNPKWMKDVETYWESIQNSKAIENGWHGAARISRPICNSGERNIMVDHYGQARLCFSTAFPGKILVKKGDLSKFWYGSDNIKEKMKTCRRLCGISHSVRRESATLKAEIAKNLNTNI